MKRIIALALLLLASSPARADWVELGVAARCSPDGISFQVVPVVRTSDTRYDINAPPDSHAFPLGEDQQYQCNIAQRQVRLLLSVYGPQERGMGQGAGVIIISSLTVDGISVISKPTNFNWQVTNEAVLTKIVLTKKAPGLASTLCYSNGWDWWQPYADEHCETEQIGR